MITFDEFQKVKGLCYGVNFKDSKKPPVVCDRRSLSTPHGFFFGTPGSGKTELMKKELMLVLRQTKDKVYVIDTTGEFVKTAESDGYKSRVVRPLPDGQGDSINPLDLLNEESYPMYAENVFDTAEEIISFLLNTPLIPNQSAVIQKGLRTLFKPFLNQLDKSGDKSDRVNNPDLNDLRLILSKEPDPEAAKIADVLHSCSALFGKTSLSIESDTRLVIYDISKMGILSRVWYLMCLKDIENRIYESRDDTYKWVYMSDLYAITHNNSRNSTIRRMYKTMRLYGGVLTGEVQNYEMLTPPDLRCLINNSGFMVFFNQAAYDRQLISEYSGICDEDLSMITDATTGMGFILAGKELFPFDAKFSTI